ncbi:MAG: carbamoyltransferase HypF [Betaproteobacteria bacterium]
MQATNILNTFSQRIRVCGIVQGVGFRPFVWRLAKELDLKGWVRNDAHGVEIEVSGAEDQVNNLVERLRLELPEAARIDSISIRETTLQCFAEDFFILNSRGGRSLPMIGHDTAVCRDCLAELFDSENRRWRYAFSYCTNCGPRYTISRGLPYARERTSFKPFIPCGKCQNEYRRSGGRHFQNEAVACPRCGPKIAMLDAEGRTVAGDPVEQALAILRQGKILAIKGQGGFYLSCDATSAKAVALLRTRKHYNEKPLPVMLANTLSARALVYLGVGEPGLLAMPERPIILLKKRAGCDEALPGVSEGFVWQSIMLPSTPLHYMLFHEAAGQPHGVAWLDLPQEMALVMTGASSDSEPLLISNDDALRHLSGVVDGFLVHDQEIAVRCDSSVARSGMGGLQFIRRARGYAPRAIRLLRSGPPILAVGGRCKNTVCVTRGDEAFVSPHIGDLDHASVCTYFEETINNLIRFLEVKPALVAHDPDGDIHATRFALDYARQKGIPALAVPRHHAHVAAVLAEHQIDGPVTALSLDGDGIDAVGGLWGGALLRVDGVDVESIGHMIPLYLASGIGAKEPWQVAAAVLHQIGKGHEIEQRFHAQQGATAVAQQLENPTVRASSSGCYVNAMAGLLGIKPILAFEGQAVRLLEGLAEQHGDVAPLADGWIIADGNLSLLPMFSILAEEKDAYRGAALFHSTLAAALAEWISLFSPTGGTIIGTGSCLLNSVLARGLRANLNVRGLHLIESRRLPPNDGSLAIGQAWVAQHYLLGDGPRGQEN